MTDSYFLKLFGVPELRDSAGQTVPLRTRKQLAVVVYLALDECGQPTKREILVDLLWPERTAVRGRHSLSQALAEIRKSLGRDAVSTDRFSVALSVQIRTDLDVDAPLPAAPDLERPLDGLETCAGLEFSHWVLGARARLASAFRSRLKDSLSNARSEGGVKAVRENATLLYAVDPMSDDAVLAIAESSLLEGDVGGAIRQIREHIRRSKHEFGRTPAKRIFSALRRIEQGQVPEVAGRETPASTENVQAVSRTPVLVGREDELAKLETLVSKTRKGQFASAFLKGPPGIGKSTLLRRFTESLAARNWSAFLVRCFTIGKDIPFSAVSDLINQLSLDSAMSGTDSLWLSEASRVSPNIRTLYTGIPAPPDIPPETVRLHLAEAILRMLETVAEDCPVLVAFDDIPDMDPASRDVLHVLARRLDESPTLLLASVRCPETETTLGIPGGLRDIDWQTGIDVQPLKEAHTFELIDALTTDSDTLDSNVRSRIVGLALGNPYLAEMLLSDWHNNGDNSLVVADIRGDSTNAHWSPPETMRLAFARQYEGLSENAEQLVHLLAVAGRSMPLKSIANILGLDVVSNDRAVLELIDRAVIRVEGGTIGFNNELHRAFVYFVAMPEPARLFNHTRLARFFQTHRGDSDFQNALEASFHFVKAGMINEAVELVRIGADLAITSGAPQEAEKALDAVIAVCPKQPAATLHLPLARCLCTQGKFTETLNALSTWQPESGHILDEALGATLHAEAMHRGRLADDASIKAALDCAMALTEKCGDDSLFLSALQLGAEVAAETGDWQTLGSIRERAERIGHSTQSVLTQAKACLTQGYCLVMAGNMDPAKGEFRRCISALGELPLHPGLRQAHNGLGIAQFCVGELVECVVSFRNAIDMATRIGDSDAAATSWSNMGVARDILGHHDLATECNQNALKLIELVPNPRRAVECHLNAACHSLSSGNTVHARSSLATARLWAEQTKLGWVMADVLLAEADVLLAEGSPESAWLLLEEVQRIMRGRIYALSDTGRYERLQRHHLWGTQGLEAMLHYSETQDLERTCVQLARRLEVTAFEEWVRTIEDSEYRAKSSAFEELRDRGLHGIINYLQALHITDFWRNDTENVAVSF